MYWYKFQHFIYQINSIWFWAMSRNDSTRSYPLNSNHPCYFPVGLFVYCSVNFVINPSTSSLGTTTRDTQSTRTSSLSLIMVYWWVMLPQKQLHLQGNLIKWTLWRKLLFSILSVSSQAFIISELLQKPPTCSPFLYSHVPQTHLNLHSKFIFLNSKTYHGAPLLKTFSSSQSLQDL